MEEQVSEELLKICPLLSQGLLAGRENKMLSANEVEFGVDGMLIKCIKERCGAWDPDNQRCGFQKQR